MTLPPILARATLPLALAALCLGTRPAAAQLYQIQATGTIKSISGSPQFLDGSVRVGTPYTYSFIFSTQPSDREPNDPYNGQYDLPGDIYGATVSVGDYTLTHIPMPPLGFLPAELFVGADPTTNQYGSYNNNYIEASSDGARVTSANPQATMPTFGFAGLILFSKPPFLLTTDAQPAQSAYTPGHFSSTSELSMSFNYNLSDPNTDEAIIDGTVSSLSATPYIVPGAAPEPSAFVSIGIGLVGLCALAVKARRRALRS